MIDIKAGQRIKINNKVYILVGGYENNVEISVLLVHTLDKPVGQKNKKIMYFYSWQKVKWKLLDSVEEQQILNYRLRNELLGNEEIKKYTYVDFNNFIPVSYEEMKDGIFVSQKKQTNLGSLVGTFGVRIYTIGGKKYYKDNTMSEFEEFTLNVYNQYLFRRTNE